MLDRNTQLRLLLSLSTFLTPIASARAAEGATATDYLTRKSVAAVTLRVAAAAKTPIAQPLPIEIADAALREYMGVPLDAIERITIVAEPPAGMNPLYAVVINLTQPGRLDQLPPELTGHTIQSELDGLPLFESQAPMLPSIGMLDEKTIAIGPKVFLKRLLKKEPAADSPLARAMNAKGGAKNHLHGALMLEPLRGLIQLGMSEAMKDAPPETHEYFRAVDLIGGLIVNADLSFQRDSAVTYYANNESDAERLDTLMKAGIEELRTRIFTDEAYLELLEDEDPIKQAMAEYGKRCFDMYFVHSMPKRTGPTAFVYGEIKAGEGPGKMGSVMVIGFLVSLILPAVQAAREAARRNQSLNNMKQIMLALLNYESVNGHFPPQAIYAEDGTPLLSWRVAILPYMEEQRLYDRFKLDEPWNSPNNRPLLAEMPATFFDPSSPQLAEAGGKTHYLGVTGPNAIFTGRQAGTTFREITDGTANTVALLQVDDQHAVEWTKPADYEVRQHANNPVAGIGSLHPGVFLASTTDGRTQPIELTIDPTWLAALFTRNGGEVVELP